MERLTDRCWRNLDPWECCGQNFHCSRKLNDDGGCINGCIVPKLYKHLAEYEDLEEQGLLLKLPCKIGDNIYVLEDVYGIGEFEITEYRIEAMRTGDNFSLTFDALEDEECLEVTFESLDIGKTVFLTKEEAEKALERLEKENVERD